MAVSAFITSRLETAMEKFKAVYKSPRFEVCLRSPNRKGGDREFKLLDNGKYIALVHVKKDSYKIYLGDDQISRSKNKTKYEQLNGGKFAHFNTLDEVIDEINTVQGY